MASDPMFASATAFLNALDKESDPETIDGQADDVSATESASFDQTRQFNPSQQPIHSNDPDADVKKKIVLFNLPEPFGDDQMKEQADRNAFHQVLYAINAESLAGNIREIKREGRFEQNGRPRRVIVTFTDENVQRIVVEYAPQLSKIRQLKHLALYAYKSPAQRFEPPPEQQTKRQNNKARPTRVDGYHGTSRKAPDQKFEQRGKKELRPQHPPPSDSPQLSQNSHAGSLYGSTTNPSNVNYVARSEPPRPISPQLSETSSNAGSFYGKMLQSSNGHKQDGTPSNVQSNEVTPNPQQQIFNNSFGFAQNSAMSGNGQQNGMNGQHHANQPAPFPPQMFNNAFGFAPNFAPPGNPQPVPLMSFNPTDPQFQMMMMQMYGMFLNSQQAQQNNNSSVPSNVPTSANELSEESEESEKSEEESLTEEEQNDEPTNQFFKVQSEQHTGTKKELNILVLGETGVGKSTWINGIANYMSFDTLEDALNARQPICLIASKFSFYETNETKIDVRLEPSHTEKDENETFSDQGQSSTQEPKTYQFETSKYIVNIIDTPEIGDTRGVEQDKENTRKILGAIGQYKHLHAICFLFKANEARMTLSFRYCISEILLQLHKDAVNNIIFFFTNARGTFYKPGDTMTPLNTFLTELHKERGLRIALTSDKICCTDNEAFRLVCAHFNGAKFTEEDFQNFAGSWKQSAAETHRFIEFTARQRPHHVADTVSINKARTVIFHLAKPSADVNELIESNIKVFDERKRELQNTAATLDDLKKKLLIPQIGIEVKPLNYPKTVCAAQRCIDTIQLPHTTQYQTIYKQICHDHCFLTNVDVERVPEPHLQQCAAMAGRPNCQVCECLWSTHMHIRFEQIKTSVQVEDNNTKTLIQQKQDASKVKEKMIRDCENTIDELKKEQQKIIKTSLRFGSFLQANAILPYNDAFEKYVEQTISEEEKCTDIGGERSKLDNLKKILDEYRQEKVMLNEARKNPIANGANTITPDEIEVMKAELFGLKHTGKILKNLFAATEDGLAKHQQHVTVKYSPPKQVQPANFGKYKKTGEKEIPAPSSGGGKKQQQKNNKNKYKKNKNKRK